MTQKTPTGMRLHIGILGRRNTGKSSLLNAITGQKVSIVSDTPGTTTDPVQKPMEIHGLGPVLFIDTAGIDDTGSVGSLRAKKTEQLLNRLDIGILVTDPNVWTDFESFIYSELREREIPCIIVINKCDLIDSTVGDLSDLPVARRAVIKTSALNNQGIGQLRQAIISVAPPEFFENQVILADLVGVGNFAVLVVPVDSEAPKGRLILPQAQAIRDLLDNDAWCIVVKDTELADALKALNKPPKLVVTDSQAFKQVNQTVPLDIPLTSFSILFSRFKGDLVKQAEGAKAIDRLVAGDRILIAEHCSHHPAKDDIGREKIPALLKQRTGVDIGFDYVQGHNFPEHPEDYKLIIHCGACTANRREVQDRIGRCVEAGIPITNYGLTIAFCLGILDRALAPFPDALQAFREADYVESQ